MSFFNKSILKDMGVVPFEQYLLMNVLDTVTLFELVAKSLTLKQFQEDQGVWIDDEFAVVRMGPVKQIAEILDELRTVKIVHLRQIFVEQVIKNI